MSIHQKPAFIQFVPTPKPRFRHAKRADGDAIWALRLKKNGHFLSFFTLLSFFRNPFLSNQLLIIQYLHYTFILHFLINSKYYIHNSHILNILVNLYISILFTIFATVLVVYSAVPPAFTL